MNVAGAVEHRASLFVALVFFACAIFFVERGPYRAIRYSTTGDFSTVYAAARCWLHGGNPYERAELKHALAAGGAPPDLQRDQDVNPSVYLPAALPWAALVAWLPWWPANAIWCLLSVAIFGLSLWKLLEGSEVTTSVGWLFASAALLFSPTYVGIYDGNPSVAAISLTTLAICLAPRHRVAGGILLGIASCFKPQIAVCAVGLLVLWRMWPALVAAAMTFAVSLAVGVAFVSRGWLATERQNIALSFLPGGQSDPSPTSHVAWQLLNAQTLTSYPFDASRLTDASVWVVLLGVIILFLWRRQRAAYRSFGHDAAFAAAVTLAVTYHRYYDAQLLLLLIPATVVWWREGRRAQTLSVAVCLAALAFPLQSVFARRMGEAARIASPGQFALLRFQPLAVITLCGVLALAYFPVRQQGRTESPADTKT